MRRPVFEPRSFPVESFDTGDHLDGARLMSVSVGDDAMNLAGDSNGRSRCEEHSVVLWLWAAAASNELDLSANSPNGPTLKQPFFKFDGQANRPLILFRNCSIMLK